MWIGFNWFRIGSSVGLLWARQWICWFRREWRIIWPGEWLPPVDEGPCPWTWSGTYVILYCYVFSSFVQCTIRNSFTTHNQQQITTQIYSEFITDLATSKEKLNINRFKRINLTWPPLIRGKKNNTVNKVITGLQFCQSYVLQGRLRASQGVSVQLAYGFLLWNVWTEYQDVYSSLFYGIEMHFVIFIRKVAATFQWNIAMSGWRSATVQPH
jgi:hypothetical protein